jgi:hypothetical protein
VNEKTKRIVPILTILVLIVGVALVYFGFHVTGEVFMVSETGVAVPAPGATLTFFSPSK